MYVFIKGYATNNKFNIEKTTVNINLTIGKNIIQVKTC